MKDIDKQVRQRSANSVSAFLEDVREAQPALKAAWDETAIARAVALTLARMRSGAGMSQTQLAELAGWNKSHVSRLESATNGVPDLATIVRYATACGMTLSLAAARPAEAGAQIVSALPLNDHVAEAATVVEAAPEKKARPAERRAYASTANAGG